jgi:hypothetical protein
MNLILMYSLYLEGINPEFYTFFNFDRFSYICVCFSLFYRVPLLLYIRNRGGWDHYNATVLEIYCSNRIQVTR